MPNQEFIEQIAKYVIKYAKSYGILVHSPIIAQAILESASGTSELALNAHNYFGLKYREGRCPTCIGTYIKVGSEQNPDGSYVSSVMTWCKFSSMEDGVVGYFDFINIPNYSNLKGVTDPETYLINIKSDNYATSVDYVSSLMSVIQRYDLLKYDDELNSDPSKEESSMSNSSLVNCKVMSPNHSGKRTHKIDRITPHCVVGQLSAESIGGCFTSTSVQASCNYGIGKDGRICLIVDEANRSWCTSSNANDQRAVTIECASDKTSPYAMTNEVYNSLINLCVDICKRNGANKLIWFADKNTSLNYEPKSGEMVLTVHRWFANKSCPGDWLYSRLGDLASRVTAILGGTETGPTNPDPADPDDDDVNEIPTAPFSVKVIIDDLNYRSEPSMSGKVNGQTGKGVFTIVEVKNGWGRLKSGAGWIYLENPDYCTIEGSVKPSNPDTSFKVKIDISNLYIRKGPGTNYGTNGYTGKGVFTIMETKSGTGSTKGWGRLKSGAGWISLDYASQV